MRKLVVTEWMSLDGVVQSPSYPDEDPGGGFRHGGWALDYFDDRAMAWVVANLEGAGGLLFGRRTWEAFAAYWPGAPAEEGMLARPLNSLPKYVASRALAEPLAWRNSALLGSDVPAAVGELKREAGGYLLLIGSSALARTLLEHDLVDELRLMIDPLVLGGGKGIFPEDGRCRRFRLVASEATGTGALLVTYSRADAAQPE